MNPEPLPQYIRMFRKQTGLSQTDVARLIGLKDERRLSKYERGLHLPQIEIALALEIVLDAKVTDIFKGVAVAAGELTRQRARRMLESMNQVSPSSVLEVKIGSLMRIAEAVDEPQSSTS